MKKEERKDRVKKEGGKKGGREGGNQTLSLDLVFSLDLDQLPLMGPSHFCCQGRVPHNCREPLATPNGLASDPLLSETVADG